MKRYHKQVGFPKDNNIEYNTKVLNDMEWNISKHAFDKVMGELNLNDLKDLGGFVKHIILSADDVFEYYEDNNHITKLCYRIAYSHYQDIILVVGNDKTLVTLYLNDTDDEHKTLNRDNYNKGVKS